MDQSEEFCSQVCLQKGVKIAGSALNPNGNFAGYILVEHQGNWERKLKLQNDYLGSIYDILARSPNEYRLQAIEHDNQYCRSGFKKVIWYKSTENPQYYEKQEYDVQKRELKSFFNQLVNGQDISKYRRESSYYQDILVCIHTRRDRCCGKFGHPIYKSLRADQKPNTRIWKSSHLKGHRTAPTMVYLPQGRFWGYMNTEIAKKVRDKEPLTDQEWDKHYRGLVNLYPAEQRTDKEALKRFGWEWSESELIIKSKKLDHTIRTILESGENKLTLEFDREEIVIDIGPTRCQDISIKRLQKIDE